MTFSMAFYSPPILRLLSGGVLAWVAVPIRRDWVPRPRVTPREAPVLYNPSGTAKKTDCESIFTRGEATPGSDGWRVGKGEMPGGGVSRADIVLNRLLFADIPPDIRSHL